MRRQNESFGEPHFKAPWLISATIVVLAYVEQFFELSDLIFRIATQARKSRPLRRLLFKIGNGFYSVSGKSRLRQASSDRGILSLVWHQPLIRTPQCQLNPKGCGEQDVDFACLDFLQVAGGNLGALSQFILRQTLANPLPTHICAKDTDSLPFFTGNRHDILHRFSTHEMNDTYIVKRISLAPEYGIAQN